MCSVDASAGNGKHSAPGLPIPWAGWFPTSVSSQLKEDLAAERSLGVVLGDKFLTAFGDIHITNGCQSQKLLIFVNISL